MEKVISFLGGKPNGSDRTGVFDVPYLLKLLIMTALTFGSITFTAGAYFSNAKDIPDRVVSIERKQDRVEARLDAILTKLDSTSADVRELRACILNGRNDVR